MSRRLLILTVVAAFAFVAAVASPISKNGVSAMPQNSDSAPIGNESWTARMGWRYVEYREGDISLSLPIEPMVKGDDRVYVPDEASWLKGAPSWKRERISEVLTRLRSVAWNRKLTWQECECPFSLGPNQVIPGSLESTAGGSELEDRRLFEPGSKVTHEQAHKNMA